MMHKMNPNHDGDTFNSRHQTRKNSECTYTDESVADDMNEDETVADVTDETDTQEES